MTDSKPRIMVVDDVPAIRSLITDSLRGAGLEVVATARNGEEAIAQASAAKPDLIILDIVMPVVPGYEALPILREAHPETVIVMLTSTSERNLIMECRRNGADGFIIKKDTLAAELPQRIMGYWQNRTRASEA